MSQIGGMPFVEVDGAKLRLTLSALRHVTSPVWGSHYAQENYASVSCPSVRSCAAMRERNASVIPTHVRDKQSRTWTYTCVQLGALWASALAHILCLCSHVLCVCIQAHYVHIHVSERESACIAHSLTHKAKPHAQDCARA